MNAHIAGPDEFAQEFDVSRETLDRLDRYARLLRRWNARINLVGERTLHDIWHRHFADSAQLWRLRPPVSPLWRDLGSGAGFPGLVLAALAMESSQDRVDLVESDGRKAAFLQTVARELALPVHVHNCRLEALRAPPPNVVTARALAPLRDLILFTEKCRDPSGTALFPKGETVHSELADALAIRQFDYKLHPSLTDPGAAVVEIGAIHGARR